MVKRTSWKSRNWTCLDLSLVNVQPRLFDLAAVFCMVTRGSPMPSPSSSKEVFWRRQGNYSGTQHLICLFLIFSVFFFFCHVDSISSVFSISGLPLTGNRAYWKWCENLLCMNPAIFIGWIWFGYVSYPCRRVVMHQFWNSQVYSVHCKLLTVHSWTL